MGEYAGRVLLVGRRLAVSPWPAEQCTTGLDHAAPSCIRVCKCVTGEAYFSGWVRWCKLEKRQRGHGDTPRPVTGHICRR